jgi:hypothetical protein
MKGVIILGVILVVLGAGIWWFIMHETMKDPGDWVGLAFGNPTESAIEMHLPVELMTVTKDYPRVNERGDPLWEEWISQHYNLQDASGESVAFSRIGWSPLISEDKTKVVPEFYVKCTLQKGAKYTFDVIPHGRTQQKFRYRHVFTAPSEPQDMQRVLFDPVTVTMTK